MSAGSTTGSGTAATAATAATVATAASAVGAATKPSHRRVVALRPDEETKLLLSLSSLQSVPPELAAPVRRLVRKLTVRRTRRRLGVKAPLGNIDSRISGILTSVEGYTAHQPLSDPASQVVPVHTLQHAAAVAYSRSQKGYHRADMTDHLDTLLQTHLGSTREHQPLADHLLEDVQRLLQDYSAQDNAAGRMDDQLPGLADSGGFGDSDRNQTRCLERFQTSKPGHKVALPSLSVHLTFQERLEGLSDAKRHAPVTSPFTGRTLKPFIRRDYESKPPKLRVLEEIASFSWSPKSLDNDTAPLRPASIDYCYIRPYMLSRVNLFVRQFFWPGIDLSEMLKYPDFGIVVLYKKLVIGCAFLLPDVKVNEAYITYVVTHPEWQRCGIGSFMLYHLIQSCPDKDITLHVSATNPAMLLYQRFGFKPEDYIIGFYDKFYPDDSPECKNAFFMRLRR